MLRQAVHLTTVVLAVLLCARTAATVECFCSDCTGGRTHCHGEMCISQVTLDHDTGEEIRRRRCLDDHLQICNRSSTIFSTLCCNTSDYCNLNFDAELAGEGEASGDSSSTTAGSAATTIPSQSPEPTTPSSATQGTAEPPSSPQPVSYPSSIECFVSESSQPILTSTTLCLGTSSCFISLRVKADGTRVYKRGCSRGSTLCEEEDRPRKKKACCYSLFCNHGIPASWVEEGTAAPTDSMPVSSQTLPTEPATRPEPASLSTASTTPSGSPSDENCTVIEEDTIILVPCVGPGSMASSPPPSLPVTEPSPDTPDGFTGPIIIPENGTPIAPEYIICYCNTCGHTYQCTSLIGCSSQYRYNPQLDQIDILRSCIADYSFRNNTCGTNQLNVQTACCLTDMCNRPPVNVDRPTLPAEGNVTVETTEPITAGTDAVTSGTAAVETSTSGGTRDSPTESETGQKEDNGVHTLMFYVFSAVLGTLMIALALVLIMMCFCCYSYHRRRGPGAKLPTGRGGGAFAVATRKVERVTVGDKVADLQDSSCCNTASTRTSTPESIV